MSLASAVKGICDSLAMMHLYRVIGFNDLNHDVTQISRAT
jgi:hypothetical protein